MTESPAVRAGARPLRVAVIGSGPSGAFSAQELAAAGAQVDVLDRLPTPYGLVRYGVAPDHPKIKSVTQSLRMIFETPGVRFLGNVEFGTDITVEELQKHYDAVIVAAGASLDRRLGIPGEELPGVCPATEFVSWYSGHPDAQLDPVALDADAAVVVGAGNVALDVARMLVRGADELRRTDVPRHVLEVLSASRISDIYLLARRGAAYSRFSSKELLELDRLEHADVLLDPAELELSEADEQAVAAQPATRRAVAALGTLAARPHTGRSKRIHLLFGRRPVAIEGSDRVDRVQVERTQLDESGAVTGTGEHSLIKAGLVLRSLGNRGKALPGLPFDARSATVPHQSGRVVVDGAPASGLYVVGWIKRGPSGVIGTNKRDAAETVAALLHDVPSLPVAPIRDPGQLPAILRSRGVQLVGWSGWLGIDRAEVALGQQARRERIKIHDREGLLSAGLLSDQAAGNAVQIGRKA